jgi:hypothetical protein
MYAWVATVQRGTELSITPLQWSQREPDYREAGMAIRIDPKHPPPSTSLHLSVATVPWCRSILGDRRGTTHPFVKQSGGFCVDRTK